MITDGKNQRGSGVERVERSKLMTGAWRRRRNVRKGVEFIDGSGGGGEHIRRAEPATLCHSLRFFFPCFFRDILVDMLTGKFDKCTPSQNTPTTGTELKRL